MSAIRQIENNSRESKSMHANNNNVHIYVQACVMSIRY